MTQQAWYKPRRIRVITVLIAILLLIIGAVVWTLNSEHRIQGDWSTLLPIVFVVLALIVALLTWVFPSSPDQPETPALPLVRELIREGASFRMGDKPAANFDYIIEPINDVYDKARQALRNASVGAGPKRGILILGPANAGKTRLAFEVLTQALPHWKVLLWNATYGTSSKVPVPTVSSGLRLVIFIDDLQAYVLGGSNGTEGPSFLSDTRCVALEAFFQSMQAVKHLVVVATCRLEDIEHVEGKMRWLFDQLNMITLQRFPVEVTDPKSAPIIDLFQ